MKILVTGANGVVGRAFCSVIGQSGYQVVRVVRKSTTPWEVPIGAIDEITNWDAVLDPDVGAVVHLAALISPAETVLETGAAHYHQVNVLGTANLARQCAARGVKRFVFVSSVKVLGEGRDQPYRSDDMALPGDAYAVSKWEAEQALKQIAAETGMEVVILRPPLVYGPGVKGNFLRLMQAVDRRHPLPFGAIHNRRSLIYLGNLVDALRVCLTHPDAAGKTFLVSDGSDVSTPELVRRIAAALGRSTFLLPVPVSSMRFVGKVLGKQDAIERLVGSLAVDIQPIQKDLGWSPPYSMQAGLAATIEWYRKLAFNR